MGVVLAREDEGGFGGLPGMGSYCGSVLTALYDGSSSVSVLSPIINEPSTCPLL